MRENSEIRRLEGVGGVQKKGEGFWVEKGGKRVEGGIRGRLFSLRDEKEKKRPHCRREGKEVEIIEQ